MILYNKYIHIFNYFEFNPSEISKSFHIKKNNNIKNITSGLEFWPGLGFRTGIKQLDL